MHVKDDLLRAYIDQEIPAAQRQQVREHLSRCAGCSARFDEMTTRANEVQSLMNHLAPSPIEQPRPARSAYARFAGSQQRAGRQNPMKIKEIFHTMSTKRSLLTALAVLTLIALVFSITPARAWASDLLGLFRVQKVQVISIDPAAIRNADGKMNDNRAIIEQIFDENLKINEHGDRIDLASADEAASRLGFTPRVPAAFADAKFALQPGLDATFTIDQPRLQGLIDAMDANVKLPESVNGEVVTANVPDALMVSSGCSAADMESSRSPKCDLFFQMYAPEVNAPADLDIPKLGQAMFQFLGLSADEARDLSQRVDWATTLVLPIPQDADIQYEEVQVDGATGTLLKAEKQAMLIWVKDGMLYSVRTGGSAAHALEIAASLQ